MNLSGGLFILFTTCVILIKICGGNEWNSCRIWTSWKSLSLTIFLVLLALNGYGLYYVFAEVPDSFKKSKDAYDFPSEECDYAIYLCSVFLPGAVAGGQIILIGMWCWKNNFP